MAKKLSPIERFSSKLENHKLSLGATEEVTYFVNRSGTDSVSSPYIIYFDYERPAVAITIRVSAVCSITEFNGLTLKSPITLNAGANNLKVETTHLRIVATGATVVEVTLK